MDREVSILRLLSYEIMKDHCICVSIVMMAYVRIDCVINYRFPYRDEPDLVNGKGNIF